MKILLFTICHYQSKSDCQFAEFKEPVKQLPMYPQIMISHAICLLNTAANIVIHTSNNVNRNIYMYIL